MTSKPDWLVGCDVTPVSTVINDVTTVHATPIQLLCRLQSLDVSNVGTILSFSVND